MGAKAEVEKEAARAVVEREAAKAGMEKEAGKEVAPTAEGATEVVRAVAVRAGAKAAAYREVLSGDAHAAHQVERRRLANVGHADEACVPRVTGGYSASMGPCGVWPAGGAIGRGASLSGVRGSRRPMAVALLWQRACRALMANPEGPQRRLPSHCSRGGPAARASPAPARARDGTC